MRSAFFWDVTQRIPTFRHNLSVPSSRVKKFEKKAYKMGKISCPEMSVRNYNYTLGNVPEERRSHVKVHYLLLRVYTSRVILRQRGQNRPRSVTIDYSPTWRQLQKIMNFLLFSENLMLITAFTRARHWFLFWNMNQNHILLSYYTNIP